MKARVNRGTEELAIWKLAYCMRSSQKKDKRDESQENLSWREGEVGRI